MKKLVLLLSFVFVLGLISVNAQVAPKKVAVKAPAKTEAAKPAVKPAVKGAVKPVAKKVATPAK